MLLNEPTVSAIIPSIGRDSLRASVESVTRQTYETKAIVVLDDPEKIHHVKELLDGLSFELVVTPRVGAPKARNYGIESAATQYLAFLDDDDEWHLDKIRIQMEALRGHEAQGDEFVVCRTIFKKQSGRVSKSKTLKFNPAKEAIQDYLVQRKTLFYGSTYFCTSSLLLSKELALRSMWDEDLKKHQDWDLFIRLIDELGATPVQVDEQLVIVNQGSTASISNNLSFQKSKKFFEKHLRYRNSRATSDFIWIHIYLGILSEPRTHLFGRIPRPVLALPHFAALVRFGFGCVQIALNHLRGWISNAR